MHQLAYSLQLRTNEIHYFNNKNPCLIRLWQVKKQAMKKIVLYVATILCAFNCLGQDKKVKDLSLRAGMNYGVLSEKRFTNLSHNGSLRTFSLDLSTLKGRSRQKWNTNFSYVSDFTRESNLSYTLILPEVRYSYTRALKNNWLIGGNFHSFTLLNFPKSELTRFVNNSISYSLSQSIGPVLVFEENGLGKKITFSSELHLALLSYTIRPAFAHPYPENYLNPDIFSPDRSGMAMALIKGGKIQTINNIQNLHFTSSLKYPVNNWGFSATAFFSTIRMADIKQFQFTQLYLGLGVHYKMNKNEKP